MSSSTEEDPLTKEERQIAIHWESVPIAQKIQLLYNPEWHRRFADILHETAAQIDTALTIAQVYELIPPIFMQKLVVSP